MSQRSLKRKIDAMHEHVRVLRTLVDKYKAVIADLGDVPAVNPLWNRVANLEHKIGAIEGEITFATIQIRGSWRSRHARWRVSTTC